MTALALEVILDGLVLPDDDRPLLSNKERRSLYVMRVTVFNEAAATLFFLPMLMMAAASSDCCLQISIAAAAANGELPDEHSSSLLGVAAVASTSAEGCNSPESNLPMLAEPLVRAE
jgi:hypothetical protein